MSTLDKLPPWPRDADEQGERRFVMEVVDERVVAILRTWSPSERLARANAFTANARELWRRVRSQMTLQAQRGEHGAA